MKLNKQWHHVGRLFFNYHNDALSNMHKSDDSFKLLKSYVNNTDILLI